MIINHHIVITGNGSYLLCTNVKGLSSSLICTVNVFFVVNLI